MLLIDIEHSIAKFVNPQSHEEVAKLIGATENLRRLLTPGGKVWWTPDSVGTKVTSIYGINIKGKIIIESSVYTLEHCLHLNSDGFVCYSGNLVQDKHLKDVAKLCNFATIEEMLEALK